VIYLVPIYSPPVYHKRRDEVLIKDFVPELSSQ